MDETKKVRITIYEEIKKIPLLSSEEEKELGEKILMGDKEAEKKLIYHNLRLVLKKAGEFSKKTQQPFDDIFQNGVLGLAKAAHKYDVTTGNHFSAMAVYWIEQRIRREISNTEALIRKPVYQEELYYKIKKEMQELMKELNRAPSIKEIALRMKKKEEKIKETLDAFRMPASIQEMEREGTTIDDKTEQIDPVSLEETVLNKIEVEEIKQALNVQEQYVLVERIGLDGDLPKTLEQVAKQMNISPQRVSQIEIKAKKKIERKIEREKYRDSLKKGKEPKVFYIDILSAYQDWDLDVFISIYEEQYEALDKESKELLHKFFFTPSIKEMKKEDLKRAQKEINLALFPQTDFYEGFFSFEETKKEEVIKILRNPLWKCSTKTRETLLSYYGIKGRMTMTVEEKKRITEILTPFYREKDPYRKVLKKYQSLSYL